MADLVRAAVQAHEDRERGQRPLFGEANSRIEEILAMKEEWSREVRAIREIEVLGVAVR